MTDTKTATVPAYFSTLIPANTVPFVIDALRAAFVQRHADETTPADAWDEHGAWSPGGIWTHSTDTACTARLDHYYSVVRFAHQALGIRASGSNDFAVLNATIRSECEASRLVVEIPGLGFVQPSYATHHGLKPSPRPR
ncbi:hypothetical protein [Kribbella italica]|uniref:Uncharacterized protein n=1 Tax=Kribbella italica TaxID=1540520 RepID=A0A7W9JEH5_9ACTN|nr:hypothetical protein [Kribbella italica]MBB5840500.1 hypothetical protein [Kribbella italica]